jgi:hypothetical protein
MKPGEIASFLCALFLPVLILAAVVLAPRACEIAAGTLVLLAALRAGGEVICGRPNSPLGRWGAAWVMALFGLVGSTLLAWGFFAATFLAAGYISATLLALAVFSGDRVWGSRADAWSGRFVLFVLGLIAGGYALAGALGWSPADEVDARSFATFPGPFLVMLAALLTAMVGTAVWYRGLELRSGRWVRNGRTKTVAVALFGMAAAILVGGLRGLSLLW